MCRFASWPPKDTGGGLLVLIKDKIPFVEITAAFPQSPELFLERMGFFITMPNGQQQHIHNIYIPPRSSCSVGHNESIAHLISNNEMSLIGGDINSLLSRWDTNTNEGERGEQLANEIDAASTILIDNGAPRQPKNGRWSTTYISLASNGIAFLSVRCVSTSLAIDYLRILITINTELYTIND